MTSTDARGARSAGEPRSQGESLTKRGRASPISGGWAPEGLTTHKITAETFPSQERASPRDPCGETIPGWKEAKRFSAPRPRKGDDSWGPGLGTAPPLQVPEATESPWEGRRVRPPWAGPGDIPESTGVAHCLLAACPGPAMGLTDRPAPALTSATARGPRSQLGAAEDGSTLGIATSSTERPARGGQREGAAEPEAMAGDADCPVHGGEGTGRPTPSALPRTLCRQLCSGVSLPYSQNLPQPARPPAQCPSEVPQTSPGGGNPKTKSDAGWCEVRGNRPGMGSPPRAEVRGGHEPGQVCSAGSRDVRPLPQGTCLGPFSAQAPETRWTSSPRTCMLRGPLLPFGDPCTWGGLLQA